MNRPSRPVLRYHGGKWRIADWIIGQFPEHRVYVEPYGGAAGVLLQKPRSEVEVFNDSYRRVVSLFRVLRDPESAERLTALLQTTPYSYVEYMEAREVAEDPIEDARRLIILGHQGYGSTGASGGKLTGWRRSDRGNRSTSARDWQGLPEQVMRWCERLQGVFLECADAIEVNRRYDGPDTLFYIDPPYVAETRKCGSGSYAHEMTDAEHIALAEVLKAVEGRVVVSGYASPLYDHLYREWPTVERFAQADYGNRTVERLWLSPNIEAQQTSLFELAAIEDEAADWNDWKAAANEQ